MRVFPLSLLSFPSPQGNSASISSAVLVPGIREDLAQVPIGLQAIGLSGFNKTAQVGAGLDAIDAGGEEPALASHHKRSNGIFRRVVVNTEPTVLGVDGELVPVLVQIA